MSETDPRPSIESQPPKDYRWGEVAMDHPDVITVVAQSLGHEGSDAHGDRTAVEDYLQANADFAFRAFGAADAEVQELAALIVVCAHPDNPGQAEIVTARTAAPETQHLAGPLLRVVEERLAYRGIDSLWITGPTDGQAGFLESIGYQRLEGRVEDPAMFKQLGPPEASA